MDTDFADLIARFPSAVVDEGSGWTLVNEFDPPVEVRSQGGRHWPDA